MRFRFRNSPGRFLAAGLILTSLFNFSPTLVTVRAQRRVIVVNAEQPNVWTLEQAHYLLAQMHRRNLDLKAKSLEDLDANEIAGLRFDVMRMLIEFGATFNQAELASNRMLTENREFNAERRHELIVERDRLRRQSLTLTGEISDLESEKADTKDEEEKKSIDAKIASRKTRRDKVDKEIEFLNEELKTLSGPTGDPKATTGEAKFEPDRLPKSSAFDKPFADAAAEQIKKFSEAPKINASLRLENFLQMQIEIIAKQLTLLRDEVSPGERLLFLELPQTVNVAHHEADKKWAQSWWKIAGYTVRCPDKEALKYLDVPEKCKEPGTQAPDAPRYNMTAMRESLAKAQKEQTDSAQQATQPGGSTWQQNQKPITTAQDAHSLLNNKTITVGDDPAAAGRGGSGGAPQVNYVNKFVNLDVVPQKVEPGLQEYLTENKVSLSNRIVRTVDLIPRQSSLNVNDMKLNVKAGAFNFVLSTLFGFGSRLNIQRQREQFSQFVQQELYSAAFGKGAREFGWTFTPMPGTDRLMSGVRTTYAAVVVPEEAVSLVVESNGCYFPRSFYPPNNFEHTRQPEWNEDSRTSRNCGTRQAFVIPIPSASLDGSNDFWVEGISYQPVAKGERVVVLVSGKNFSSQIGVLVNGVPLAHSVGLAQPLIRDDSRALRDALADLKGEKVRGRVERVDTNKIVFSFDVDNFVGTPTITLVAPGKAIDINWLDNVTINGKGPATLLNSHRNKCEGSAPRPNCVTVADWMFGKRPPTIGFKIDSVEVFRGRGGMRALLHGAGFMPATPPGVMRLFINGASPAFTVVSPELIEVMNFPVPADDTIQVTLVYDKDTVQAPPVANPGRMKVTNVTVVTFEEASNGEPSILVVRLEGFNFPNRLVPSDPVKMKVVVTSATEAFLTITNPRATEVVTLTDPVTNLSVNAVITRRPPAR